MNSFITTIVIPTYKRPDRIARAVQSALSQTCKPLQVVVVDDNGKNTAESELTQIALKQYMESNQIQMILNDKNSGGSFSRNEGLKIAEGKYITFLDDDDEIHSDKLQKQVERLENLDDSYTACYTGFHKLLENGSCYRSAENIEGDVFRYALSRSILLGSGSNLLVKTARAREIGGYDISFKRNQDLEFFARIIQDHKLAFVDEDLMTIHYEIRETKQNYETLVGIDQFYLEKMNSLIHSMSKKEQNRIYSTVALDRFRYSLPTREIKDGWRNLHLNHVGVIRFVKYMLYLMYRVIFKKAYGFKG